MEQVCAQSADFHESLDPYAPAAFAVSWAGECESLTWFDTARELTERWHHQQQIRLATQRPGIMTPELYRPVVDCFLRGLPYCLREVALNEAAMLLVEISGDCGLSDAAAAASQISKEGITLYRIQVHNRGLGYGYAPASL